MNQPLEGIRVLDLTRLLPGPLCSLFLADLGADIVKIEAPMGGDYARWMPPLRQQMGAAFAAMNRNKRSLALDLKKEAGAEAFRRMVKKADVVLEGFRPGVMERLGLGYESLKAIQPKLIYCAISGYGQDGPMAKRAGHDINYQAISGVLERNGSVESGPMVTGIQPGDVAGGSMSAVASILAALFRRERTQQGAFCDVSMTDNLLPFLSMELGNLAAGHQDARGEGPITGGIPCYGVYKCGDGKFLSVGSLEPKFWKTFVEAIGCPELVTEGMETGKKGAEIRQKVEAILSQKTRDEWVTFFEQVDACVEPVLEMDELTSHPHHVARENFVTHEHPTEGTFQLPRSPFRLSEYIPPPHTGAPALGEHSKKLLSSFDFSDEEVESLVEQGVILAP